MKLEQKGMAFSSAMCRKPLLTTTEPYDGRSVHVEPPSINIWPFP